MKISIYNLEFPAYVDRLVINGYRFERILTYVDRVRSLQHTVTHISEIEVQANYGTNAITAEVTTPDPEPPARLEWGKSSATQLDDILLILSLFTMRHVWADSEQGW